MSIKNMKLKSYAGQEMRLYYDVAGIKYCRSGLLTLITKNDIISHVSVSGAEACANIPLSGSADSSKTSVEAITDLYDNIVYPEEKRIK